MKILLYIFLFFLSISYGYSQELIFKKINITCPKCLNSESFKDFFSDLLGKKIDENTLKERLVVLRQDPRIKNINTDIITNTQESELVLNVSIIEHKIIEKVSIQSNYTGDLIRLRSLINLKEGDFVDAVNEEQINKSVDTFFKEKGISAKKSIVRIDDGKFGTIVNITANAEAIYKIKQISVSTDIPDNLIYLTKRFQKFKNKLLDKLEINVALDVLSKEMFSQGHFFSQVTIKEIGYDKENLSASLVIVVEYGQKFNFNFRGNTILTKRELQNKVVDSIKNTLGKFEKKDLEMAIVDFYKNSGIYLTQVMTRVVHGKTKEGVQFSNYYFDIVEGKKIEIASVEFRGNNNIVGQHLLKLFYKKGTTLIKRGFLDEKYLEDYVSILKEEYLRNGFVFIKVSPAKIIDVGSKKNIEFSIIEGPQVVVKKINLISVDDNCREKILSNFINRENIPLNVIELTTDLRNLQNFLKEDGYFFSRILNIDDHNIVTYSKDYSEADINIDLDLGKKIIFDNVVISGNIKTREQVIKREIHLKRGDVIKSSMIEEIRGRLESLGLFSIVKVTPIPINSDFKEDFLKVNLLIQVQEIDFGVFDIAPGYRTDLGLKLSTGILYNNMWGMNRIGSLRVQGNQRLDYSNFDARRREARAQKIEYIAQVSLFEPYLLRRPYQLDTSVSSSMTRFYSFDAKIFRTSIALSKNLTSKISASLRYQLESISQFDATKLSDQGYFRIGGITPTLNFDWRNHPVRPIKGFSFSISSEIANPYFSSMDTDNIEINFIKNVARSKIYFPIVENVNLAIFISGGYQENLSKSIKTDEFGNVVSRGYIPSIKVFRLDGIDNIRGYSSSEANRLGDGRDISEVIISNKAYFNCIKVEPRFLLNDNMMAGPFFDAGRVYYNTYRPSSLRSSIGVTFKLLTPVGSLDFDYGVKTKRNAIDGGAESFGRIHLSVGSF